MPDEEIPEELMNLMHKLTGQTPDELKEGYKAFKKIIHGDEISDTAVAMLTDEEVKLYNKMDAARVTAEKSVAEWRTLKSLFWATVETNYNLQGKDLRVDPTTTQLFIKK